MSHRAQGVRFSPQRCSIRPYQLVSWLILLSFRCTLPAVCSLYAYPSPGVTTASIRHNNDLAFRNDHGLDIWDRHYARRLLYETRMSRPVVGDYHTNSEIESFLKEFTTGHCRPISRFFSIGKSVQGRDLWVLEISDKPGQEELEPNFKYVANMHGDEPLGRELLVHLAEWLCDHYVGKREPEPRAKRIVEDLHLYMLLAMNPDGFESKSRTNANRIDLNRDYPDAFSPLGVNALNIEKRQPETAALMRWTLKTPFVASANFHEGALVANYPWDGSASRRTEYATCPDDSAFRHLALTYSRHHQFMAKSRKFQQGITNGAEWYPVYGGMQDWNYLVGKCFDLTVEMHDRKWPSASHLKHYFNEHLQSLLHLPLVASLGGVRGTVRDSLSNSPLPAATINARGTSFYSPHRPTVGHTFGDFYRPLAPGNYDIIVDCDGYETRTILNVVVPSDNSGVSLDVLMAPKGHPIAVAAATPRAHSDSGSEPEFPIDIPARSPDPPPLEAVAPPAEVDPTPPLTLTLTGDETSSPNKSAANETAPNDYKNNKISKNKHDSSSELVEENGRLAANPPIDASDGEFAPCGGGSAPCSGVALGDTEGVGPQGAAAVGGGGEGGVGTDSSDGAGGKAVDILDGTAGNVNTNTARLLGEGTHDAPVIHHEEGVVHGEGVSGGSVDSILGSKDGRNGSEDKAKEQTDYGVVAPNSELLVWEETIAVVAIVVLSGFALRGCLLIKRRNRYYIKGHAATQLLP